jgi:hypothetical protein
MADDEQQQSHIDASGIVDMDTDSDDNDTNLVQVLRPLPPPPLVIPPPVAERPWHERISTPPAAGLIRPLMPPCEGLEHWWARDRTLTEWTADIEECEAAPIPVGGDIILPGAAALHPSDYANIVRALLWDIQHQRWLARKFLRRIQQRIWSRRVQCDVDLIENTPVSERDAVLLTDTRNRAIYRFHRRDIFNNLLSKITAADEFLPMPRPPTNPWTNQPLTHAQTIALCQRLTADYATRGTCPPVLFAAFCASGYDIHRYESENPSLLGQHAIQAFFRDIHDHNRDTFCETLFQLLADAGVNYSMTAIRRWARQSPLTLAHRDWLAIARDYTLWLNLHLQPRRTWNDEAEIHREVRELYARTPMREADTAGPRLRALRMPVAPPSLVRRQALTGEPIIIPFRPPTTSALSLLFPDVTTILDISGNGAMSSAEAIALIHQALFRM